MNIKSCTKVITAILACLPMLTFNVLASDNQLKECHTDNCKEYFKAYRLLTKRGHSEAMATLGEFYYAGYGTEKNNKKALKWFRRAGKYGVMSAKHKAGVIYLQDPELEDIEEGIDFLQYASNRGFSPSSLLLGKIYLTGSFVDKDLKAADELLSLAYESDNSVAIDYAELLYSHPKSKDLPLDNLFAMVEKDNLVLLNENGNDQIKFPKNEMETITVTTESFEGLFNKRIAVLNNQRPDTKKGTGTNIAGMTCADLWACSSEQDGERIRDVLLSDWGLIAQTFRLQ
ncbi:tetratricopeptide repeat protein [Shewanella sp. TC10]|uniref:tetratricopeptide repeat protein n=1 Tax=Shewanella sp. TC10 TaxID=1419739 RepID=UPI00129E5A66|nr:tetratricopeptide repeat protein [Shewanella sp. TC10]